VLGKCLVRETSWHLLELSWNIMQVKCKFYICLLCFIWIYHADNLKLQFIQWLQRLLVPRAGVCDLSRRPVYNPDGRRSHLVQQLIVPTSVPAYFSQTVLGRRPPRLSHLHSLAWPVNSPHDQLVTWSTRHSQLVTRSSRHIVLVNSSHRHRQLATSWHTRANWLDTIPVT